MPAPARSAIDPRAFGKAVALAATAVVAALLFWSGGEAVREGLAWHEASEMAVVAPDYEQRDPSRAKVVPDFTLPDRFGRPVSLSGFEGADLLIVNIWSSSCPPCIEEIPALAEMDRRLGSLGRAVLVTIAVDEGWEGVAHLFPTGTDLRVLFDPEEKVTKGVFGTSKFPETFVLDAERRIRARFDGTRPWHSDMIASYLESFI